MPRTQIGTDEILDSTITDADIASAAAISGSKINPDFGSQAVHTTSYFDFRETTAPLGVSGSAIIYFDSTTKRLRASEDGGVFVNMVGSGGISGTGTNGEIAIWTSPTTIGDDSALVFDTTNHRLGIGTASPQTDIHAFGTGPTLTLQTSNTSNPGVNFWNSSSILKFSIGYHPVLDIGFLGYGGNTHINVSSSGKVGIQNTSPSYLLSVGDGVTAGDQAISINTPAANQAIIDFSKIGTTKARLYVDSGSNNLTVNTFTGALVTSGNLGVAMSPSYPLDVTGSVRMSSYLALGGETPGSGSDLLRLPDTQRIQWTSGANIAGSASNFVINVTSGSNALLVNFGANSGTGGMIVYGGGPTPTTVFRADPALTNSYIKGKFGVANISPTYQLDVSGDINTSTLYRAGGTTIADSSGSYALKTSGGSVSVSAALSPTVGQVLTATGAAAATWQTFNFADTINSLGNSGASLNIDWTSGLVAKTTLTANCTFTFSGAVAGQTLTIFLTQDATGSRTVTWPAISWPGGTAPTLTTTAAKTDIIAVFFDGTTYFGFTGGLNY